jgi:hypothetical protein
MDAQQTQRTNRDTSGYAVFAAGDTGAMHVMAHEMLDNGLVEEGHERLGAWLEGRTGEGSEWIHLQWHMAVFELALGYWDDAHARFVAHLLPAATTEDALTDVPAMLWRLHLAAPRPTALPWKNARAIALESLEQSEDRYVQIHGLLVLAGARDVESLDRWLATRGDRESRLDQLVTQIGEGLRAHVFGDYRRAADALSEVLPSLGEIGGSRAQNELFVDIANVCRRLSAATLRKVA